MDGLKNFWVVGLSHWNTPLKVREQFSFSKEQIAKLIETAKQQEITSILPISTCNRTEIYGMVKNPKVLLNLLGDRAVLSGIAYVKNSNEAVSHLFNVAAGLDSQIIGDAQITGQVSGFLQIALQHLAVDAVLCRLAESAIAAGKEIKTQTHFSNGATSIAYAAVKHVVKQIRNDELKKTKVLVIGAGKMGRLTVESLLKFFSIENITILNRTGEKAAQLANELGVNAGIYSSLKEEVVKTDLIFTATSSAQPIITREFLSGENLSSKKFIDLSLPRNIESTLPATIISIDQLIETDKRKKENYVRAAKEIIQMSIGNYYEWLHRYELAQNIKSEIHDSIFDNSLDEPAISPKSKFVDGIIKKYLRHFQKEKQSRNLAA